MTTEKIVCYSDEVMLLGWAETNTRGRTVTFQLNEDSEEHPFRHFTVKNGKRAGQRFLLTLVQLDDDERAVEQTPAQLAYLLCRDETFWHFLNERSFVTIDSEESARSFVLEGCGIDSRSKLDSNPKARATWEATMYRPYLKYRETVMNPL